MQFLWNNFNKWNACDLLPVWEIGAGVEQDEFWFVLLDERVEFAYASGFVCGKIFFART